MIRPTPAASLMLTLVLFHSPLRADDKTYTIQFKELGKGQVCSYEINDEGEVYFSVAATGEKKVAQSMKFSEKTAYWEAVYEKPAGERPTRVMRGYGAARHVMDLPLLGVDKKTVVQPFEGKRVRIERKGGTYAYKIEGVTEQPTELEQMMQNDWGSDDTMSAFLPKQPVKMKETWRFNARPIVAGLVQQFGDKFDFDLKGVKGLGRLDEVYDKDGKQYAKLVSRIEVPITAIKKDGQRMALAKDDRMLIQVHYDICSDGTVRAGTVKVIPYIKMNINVAAKGKTATIDVVVKTERTVTIKESEPKK